MAGDGPKAAGGDAALPDEDTRSSVLPLDDCEYRDVSPDPMSDPSSDGCDEARCELWRFKTGSGGNGLATGGGLEAAGYKL